ncbi:GDP-fucose synthetase [Rhodoblastus sphagnicola]|uniref:GDP-L-fucose synthase n=1 Tax=Rhodoblastus sphagnicola TaxID=333368 RepID=A0A2S6N3C3_9HYPH|nr:GDP-L-fucose synthase [Rhodoblastus sphagnicola]PPQ29113.1 GDP-fucose synthetase [Rhodoblastus sphagnicola]
MARKKIWVAGHTGMVGSAIVRALKDRARDAIELVTADRSEVDLTDRDKVDHWLAKQRPDIVILAAAKVGGILANDTFPADFLFQNLAIETNVIDGAHKANVDRLVFLGSSCIYPKFASQPIQEASLLTGSLEPTNEWYAIAKIAGVKMCQAYRKQHGRRYISVMPCNLYGPADNFDLKSSHVLPALIRKFHEAKEKGAPAVEVWGTGTPLREFLHVDDLARGVIFCMDHYDGYEPINCGAGSDISIRQLAEIIAEVVGFEGDLVFDATKPDGTPKKLMDSSRISALGFKSEVSLKDGVKSAYLWYLANVKA